ncbi:MAG: bifunctional DedA family/phosphatase PAP2 family protein [Rhodomicrobiaceae bacterium]
MHEYLTNLVTLLAAHPIMTIGIVFIISLTEALFVIGIFIPSTVVLVGAGALIGSGTLAFWPILLSATLGAVAGDAISYWIGHKYRERIRQIWPFSQYIFLIDHGQSFFAKHGAKSIFIARFLPAVKSIVPGIAGMMGMNARTFTIINVISAIAWSLAHILPGALAGRGLSRYWDANPRLVLLTISAIVAFCIIWYTVKLGLVFLLPKIDLIRHWIIGRLALNDNRFTRLAIRFLKNDVGLFSSFVWATAIIGCLVTFTALLVNVLFDPQLSAADEAVSTFLQSLRSVTGDHLMVAVTMLGDARVLVVGAGLLLIWIFAHQYWKVGASVLFAIGSAVVFVPLMKLIVSRARPTVIYSGAESFSFPSGHATLSATIIGVTVLVLVHKSNLTIKFISYFLALTIITAIAFSRVYLGAHWPSDVLAGLSFGLAIVAALAFFLRDKPLKLHPYAMAVVLMAGYLGAYSVNYVANSEKWLKAYTYEPKIQSLNQKEWLTFGDAKLPSARITFKGEKAETFVSQTNFSPMELASELEATGWVIDNTTAVQRLTEMLLPSRAPLTERPTLPRYHDGKLPVLTAIHPLEGQSKKRIVIRFWKSGYSLLTLDQNNNQITKPILSGAVVVEYLEPIIFGLSELESDTSNTLGSIKSGTEMKIPTFINKPY